MIAMLSWSCLFVSGIAVADLNPWKDYDVSDAVWSVTTVKVHSNMGDAYLEGLRETWIPGNEISKELGQIEDWWIYRSDLQESGDFNLLLVVKFADTAALAPNKANYDVSSWPSTPRRNRTSRRHMHKRTTRRCVKSTANTRCDSLQSSK
jgi:hypothetical protein